MFTHGMRPEVPLHIRSAFARARVKSARILPTDRMRGHAASNENRIET
jgi:hypothetical protein